jgi:hypothetical protein
MEKNQIKERITALQQSVDFYQNQIQKYDEQFKLTKQIMQKRMNLQQVNDSILQIKTTEDLVNQYKTWLRENNELIKTYQNMLT